MSTKRESPRENSNDSPIAKKNRSAEDEQQLLKKCIDTVRILGADMVERANSGHPGAPMGCAPIAHVLFGEVMKFSPLNPSWSDRDRFILSNGHACALLYSMLHLTGYQITLEDLKKFRQLGSVTPGHPENFLTPGVEVSTGPLGQGISNAVGIAIAEKNLAATFNTEGFDIVDHYTYVICGDGCLQEGISAEACSLAGHLGLGKLIVCYDDNHITIDGDTDLTFTEDVNLRYQAYNWHVQTVDDVNDIDALKAAIDAAKEENDRPSLIKIRTIIGFGSTKQGTEKVHGAPLGKADLAEVKKGFGFNPDESFVVEEDVNAYYAAVGVRGSDVEAAWNANFAAYAAAHPALAGEYERRMAGRLPESFDSVVPTFVEGSVAATRQRSEVMLNALADILPELIGGSADLTGSNLTSLKCSGDFQKATPLGRYLRFGVREHAMAAICNGLCAHGGFRPFCATFLNFIGYAMGSVRLSALSRFGVLYIMTHDSIGQGEDGPTHQPVEMLESLRAIPNLLVFRPADGVETVGAYRIAVTRSHTPSVLSLSRQAVPWVEGTVVEKVALGAYVLTELGITTDGGAPAIILIATGSEVALVVEVAKVLATSGVGVRVVSMPCWELFDEQPLECKEQVLLTGVPVMSVEASGQHGWRKWAHATYGLTSFGCSAPGKDAFAAFGFTVPNLVEKVTEVIAYYQASASPVPSLLHYPMLTTPSSMHH